MCMCLVLCRIWLCEERLAGYTVDVKYVHCQDEAVVLPIIVASDA